MLVYCMMAVSLLVCVAHGQRETTIHNANESITKTGPNYQTIADRHWYGQGGVIDFFESINTERMDTAFSVSDLFTNTTESEMVYDAIFEPACGYNTVQMSQYTNETDAQQFICCHLRLFNNPGLVHFLSELELYFMGHETAAHLQSRVIDQVYNVADLRAVETHAISVRACKDDLRISTGETLIMRAEMIAKIMGIISRMYMFINARAEALSTCLSYPTNTTACLQGTSPELYVQVGMLQTAFSHTDAFFTSVCGQEALESFETFRSSKTTCS